jgi:hypothetical protein
MTELVWDQVGDRTYQTGVDRGVLYLSDGLAVAWNGLTSIEEQFNNVQKSYYLDGMKYLEHVFPGDFAAKLKAFTYPDEFERINGVAPDGGGLFVHDQKPMSFGLSFRTLIGDDVSGTERGYKIHLLYNIKAAPDNSSYASLDDGSTPIEFGWELSGTPVVTPGYRPTAHLSLDSTKMDSALLTTIEAILYGSSTTNPRLPSSQELLTLINGWTPLTITYNNDDTWTATGDGVTVIDSTTFEINNANALYLDADTYTISST